MKVRSLRIQDAIWVLIVLICFVSACRIQSDNQKLEQVVNEQNEMISEQNEIISDQDTKLFSSNEENERLNQVIFKLKEREDTLEEQMLQAEELLLQDIERETLVNLCYEDNGANILGTVVNLPLSIYIKADKKLAKKYPIRLVPDKDYKDDCYWELSSKSFKKNVTWISPDGEKTKVEVKKDKEKGTIRLLLKDEGTYILKFSVEGKTVYMAVKW